MKSCPNCGAPFEPYKCKCEFCGTWYFDFTAFDMSENVPYYVKFRTPYGIITTLARPELQTIEVNDDYYYACNSRGNKIAKIVGNRSCDLNVTFHSQIDPETETLYQLEVSNENGIEK